MANEFPSRILDVKKDFENGQLLSNDRLLNFSETSQHENMLTACERIAASENASSAVRILDLETNIARLTKPESQLVNLPSAQGSTENDLLQLQQQIQQLQASLSWRITAPLRALKYLLR